MDVADLPQCAVEDASYGPVPCVWDAAREGNGVGVTVVIDAAGAPPSLICPADTWANADLTGCEPIPADAPAPVQVGTTGAGVPVYGNETLAEPAHMDGTGLLAVVAVSVLIAGAGALLTRRRRVA